MQFYEVIKIERDYCSLLTHSPGKLFLVIL